MTPPDIESRSRQKGYGRVADHTGDLAAAVVQDGASTLQLAQAILISASNASRFNLRLDLAAERGSRMIASQRSDLPPTLDARTLCDAFWWPEPLVPA